MTSELKTRDTKTIDILFVDEDEIISGELLAEYLSKEPRYRVRCFKSPAEVLKGWPGYNCMILEPFPIVIGHWDKTGHPMWKLLDNMRLARKPVILTSTQPEAVINEAGLRQGMEYQAYFRKSYSIPNELVPLVKELTDPARKGR